jgi:hypothetical protein
MRAIIARAYAFLSSPSLADTVRRSGVPERFWGKWAPSADLCRDDKSAVAVSEKGYVTAQESCEVRWVAETAGRNGRIYSAYMRCSSLASTGSEQKSESRSRRFRAQRRHFTTNPIDAGAAIATVMSISHAMR